MTRDTNWCHYTGGTLQGAVIPSMTALAQRKRESTFQPNRSGAHLQRTLAGRKSVSSQAVQSPTLTEEPLVSLNYIHIIG